MTCTFDFTKCYALTYNLNLTQDLVFTFSNEGVPIDLTGILVTAEVFNATNAKVYATFTPILVEPLLGRIVLSRLSWVKKPVVGETYGWRLVLDRSSKLRGNVQIYGY